MMMALKSPLLPSPNNNMMSAFSPYTDSPSSPRSFKSSAVPPATVSSEQSNFLHPPAPASPLVSSPSDVADPSPIAPSSNGTDTTDIDDTGPESEESETEPKAISSKSLETDLKLDIANAAAHSLKPSSDEDEPNSVIHAPQGFEQFHARKSPPSIRRSTPTPAQRSDSANTTLYLPSDENQKKPPHSPASPPPISTAVPPARDWSATPRAQTRLEAEAEKSDHEKPKSNTRSSSLEDIPEAQDMDQGYDQSFNNQPKLFEEAVERLQEATEEVAALQLALSECWTLCNTLASLSNIHRQRLFSYGKGDVQGQAWKSCWKLCQKLYETRDDDFAKQVRPTLNLCKEFCQSLFEVRQRENDITDSVLRVSFELNNHLYNTHDQALPAEFRERTLEFYITLCHRLMKQRTRSAEETDSLLRACWSLAEMLFSLRQNKRDGKPANEELLGSAVQACWELCDLFREGWTQIRPDRGTPRPSQTTFTQAFHQAKRTKSASTTLSNIDSGAEDSADEFEDEGFGRINPETPTTVFEDTQLLSPDEASVPNILVLGPDANSNPRMQQSGRQKWSSSSSNLSGYSQSSEKTTSSTSTIINPRSTEDPHLLCLKLLIVKAALISGYQRGTTMTLASYVKSIPSNSFGNAAWQMNLLENYKKLVAGDPGFRAAGPSRRASVTDVGRAVQWMVSSGQYLWLQDLFRLVFGFHVEEAERRGGMMIQS